MGKKTFAAGVTKRGNLQNAGQALKTMDARKTWDIDFIQRDKLVTNGLNEKYPQNAIATLSESIKKHGLFHNLTAVAQDDGTFRIISGERRYRAIMMLSDEDYKKVFPSGIPVKKEDRSIDAIDEEIRLIEANAMERGLGFDESDDENTAENKFAEYINRKRWEISRLKELYARKYTDLSSSKITDKIANQFNMSTRQVYKYLSADKLIPELDKMLTTKKISLTQGSKIGQLPEDAQMEIYNILSQTGEVSDSDIKVIKQRAEEREEAYARLEAELEDTRAKLKRQEDLVTELNAKAEQEPKAQNIEDIIETKNMIQERYNTLQTKYDDLLRERDKLKEQGNFKNQTTELPADELLKAKSELQISQSLSSINNALKILTKDKEYLTADHVVQLTKVQSDIISLISE